MDSTILIIKVQQFEDKRIEAKASWNIRELKGKLSEIYPTSTEEQKLIYSGKLLNDTVVLKDVLREYEGQEAHTVHLVFTPKQNSRLLQSKYQENKQKTSASTIQTTSASSSSSSEMSTSELRQRHASTATPVVTTNANNSATEQHQQTTSNSNIPSNYFNSFYGNTIDANSILSQQYAMQTWMQQAYAQYMSQYMNIMSQTDQQAHQSPNFAFPMPSASVTTSTQSPNVETQTTPAPPIAEQQAQQNQPAAEPQRRFPNIIQDEQENRDWLDILYLMSRLMILLCLVYFYSSPLRCLIVILIGVSIYLYHIYRQNQNRLNNNNTNRVNLNNVRPAAAVPQAQENNENAEQNNENQQSEQSSLSENASDSEPLINGNEVTQNEEPPVPILTVMRTFVISFIASIIPDHPAM